MSDLKLNCIRIFAATQFNPFMEKILKEKDSIDILKDSYGLALANLQDMYELRPSGRIEKDKLGILNIEIDRKIPDFIKINPERLEFQQLINEDTSLELAISRFISLNTIHHNLFNNKIIKFGLIKFYEVEYSKKTFNLFYKINSEYKNTIDSCNTFILIKRDNFNINIEPTYTNEKYILKIDINDIVTPNNYFDMEHFKEILDLHDRISNYELLNIFGDKNA